MNLKVIAVYVLGALLISSLAYKWHESDKRADALEVRLTASEAALKLKTEEYDRVGVATLVRDTRFDQQDKTLSDIQKALRVLQRNDKEIRDALAAVVPASALRGLHSYNSEHQTNSAGASTPAPSNTSKP